MSNEIITFEEFLVIEIASIWVAVSNVVYFHPYLGRRSNLTNIFQMGWNPPTIVRCSTSILVISNPICKIISKEFLVKGFGSFALENPQTKKKRWKLPETAGRRWGNDLLSWEVRYPLPKRHVLSRWFSELPQVEYLILIGGGPLTLLSFTFFYTFLSCLPFLKLTASWPLKIIGWKIKNPFGTTDLFSAVISC